MEIQKTVVCGLESFISRRILSLREQNAFFLDGIYSKGVKIDLNPNLKSEPKDQTSVLKEQKLRWNRSDTDLLELVTALYESNAVKTDSGKFTKRELQSALEWMFNHPVKGSGAKLTKARDRKLEPSVFMEELKQAFSRYVLRKDGDVNRRK